MKLKDDYLIGLFYHEALQTQKGVIRFADFQAKPLGYFGKLKAQRSINYFHEILDVEPGDFRLFFFIGKNHQSLRNFEKALFYLEKSVELNTEEPLLPLEASIAAIHLGLTDKAISLVKEALKRDPENEWLIAVYAMYLLLAGQFTEAQNIINKAHKIEARDNFIIELKVIIDEVKLGHLTQPSLYTLFNK